MTDREKLIELIVTTPVPCMVVAGVRGGKSLISASVIADHLLANGVTVRQKPRPLEDWGEDYGDVLWWKFPIVEPPYIGSPLDADWPGYHTHWTPFAVPEEG